MKALFVAVLAAALVGCTSSPQTGARKSIASKVAPKSAKAIAARRAKAEAKAAPRVRHAAVTSRPSPAAPPRSSDPETEKAKAAIAAMLENPASARFSKVQRAQKKLLSRPVDTICGRVKAKSASGKSTAAMPFLYIVGHDREDEVYLVTGTSHVAQTVHGALCK